MKKLLIVLLAFSGCTQTSNSKYNGSYGYEEPTFHYESIKTRYGYSEKLTKDTSDAQYHFYYNKRQSVINP